MVDKLKGFFMIAILVGVLIFAGAAFINNDSEDALSGDAKKISRNSDERQLVNSFGLLEDGEFLIVSAAGSDEACKECNKPGVCEGTCTPEGSACRCS